MNIDLSQDEIRLLIRHLPDNDEPSIKLSQKLIHYVFPEVDQDTIAHKWQEWKTKER